MRRAAGIGPAPVESAATTVTTAESDSDDIERVSKGPR